MNRLYFVAGPPAVGKSTTGRALASRFPKGVYIPVDDLRAMVVAGYEWPNPAWGPQLVEQIALARSVATSAAIAYHRAGFSVVLDDFWHVDHDRDFQALYDYAGPNLERILLFPDQDVAHQRNLLRSGDSPIREYVDFGIRHAYGNVRSHRAALTASGWWFLDNAALDPEASVSAILAHAGEGD